MKRKVVRRPKIRPIFEKCPFCTGENVPSYRDAEKLKSYITDRARIMSTSRSGVCSRHQKRLTSEIKKARLLLLLPMAERI